MKKLTRRNFTAAGILATLGLTGCFNPFDNKPGTVYGPPPELDPSNNAPETVYGPPEDFEPDNNEPEDVYGPPVDLGDSDESGERFDPDKNTEAPVYGPPSEDFKPVGNPIGSGSESPNVPSSELGFGMIPNVYNPADNIPPAVYGPPSWRRR